MRHILIYGDSLTWGIIPGTRSRLPFEQRWPGVLEAGLMAAGEASIRVLEDCVNGRRTVWDDPFKPGRNGRDGLAQRMEMHSPLSLVILMLGTNDFQFSHPFNNAWSAGQGMAVLVKEVRNAPIEPGMPVPPILIVSPPAIRQPKGLIAEKFAGAEERCAGLAGEYARVATECGCGFFDAGTVTASSAVDGVHLDAEQHRKLGTAMVEPVRRILMESVA